MSTIKCTTIQNLSGVEVYTAKAWVNFNGTGTVAIRASGNVSSITDNGTGDYTVNFTTAMADTNYAAVATCGRSSTVANLREIFAGQPSTSSSSRFRFIGAISDAGTDVEVVNFVALR